MGGAKQVLNFGAGPAKLPPEVSNSFFLNNIDLAAFYLICDFTILGLKRYPK